MEAEINRLKHTERNKSSNTGAQQECRSCGTQHECTSQCPAKGRECYFCKKPDHFKSQCTQFLEWKKKKISAEGSERNRNRDTVQFIGQNMDLDRFDDYVIRVSGDQIKCDIIVDIENVKVPFIIASGASINVIDAKTFDDIKKTNPSLELRAAQTKLSVYGNKVAPMKGVFFSSVVRREKRAVAWVFVTEASKAGCLLSCDTSTCAHSYHGHCCY